MSTGAEHYIEAERCIASALEDTGDTSDVESERTLLAYAQVHATLALAAATALGSARMDDDGMLPVDINDWFTAASADDIGHGNDPDESPAIITEELLADAFGGDGPIEFIVPLQRRFQGVYTQVRLPIGMTAEAFLDPDKLEQLATNLGRRVGEVHPAAQPTFDHGRVLGLWIADKAATR